jgi:serine/threonine-protein kinase ULK/ATG1
VILLSFFISKLAVMVKIIEHYCLNEQIGEGEYGKVYKGSNLTTKAEVAIKVIPADKFKELPKL